MARRLYLARHLFTLLLKLSVVKCRGKEERNYIRKGKSPSAFPEKEEKNRRKNCMRRGLMGVVVFESPVF